MILNYKVEWANGEEKGIRKSIYINTKDKGKKGEIEQNKENTW